MTVESSLGVLYQVWLGALGLPAAVRDGLVTLTGRREAVRRLPGALRLSPVAPYVQKVGSGAASRRECDQIGSARSGQPPRGPVDVCGTLLPVIARTSPPLGVGCCPGCCRCCRHS